MYPLQLKQPKGLYGIVFGELCERFSYYGAQTLLVLYLTTKFFLSDDKSYALYGAYAAFAYALPVLGGVLADRLLGLKQAIVIGGVLLILGNILMMVPTLNSFYIGLALTACGTGLYKPNSSTFVGKLYSGALDKRRDSGYMLFYLGMNIGATASPLVYGLVKHWGYHYSYLTSAILLFFSWVLFLIKNYKTIPSLPQQSSLKAKWLAYGLIIVVTGLVNILFFYPILLNNFLFFFAALTIILLLITTLKYEKIERNRLFALLILSIFGMCFFAASMQVGSSINLFIQRDINRVILGWQIPTIMFTSLYPLAVIVSAPFITAFWTYLSNHNIEPTAPIKLSLSLLFASVAFICFVLATSAGKPGSHLPILWILLGNLGLGMGEVCLMPVMLSSISRYASANIQGTMMGIWCLFIAFGGYLSGTAARLSNHNLPATNIVLSSKIYSNAFMTISVICLLIALLLFTMTPWIKSLMKSQ